MNRSHHNRRKCRFNDLAALACDAELLSEQALSSGGSEADDDFGFDRVNLRFKPRAASIDLRWFRFLVNATLTAGLPFEVFAPVCDISLAAIDARQFERLIEQSSCRPHKRLAL